MMDINPFVVIRTQCVEKTNTTREREKERLTCFAFEWRHTQNNQRQWQRVTTLKNEDSKRLESSSSKFTREAQRTKQIRGLFFFIWQNRNKRENWCVCVCVCHCWCVFLCDEQRKTNEEIELEERETTRNLTFEKTRTLYEREKEKEKERRNLKTHV